MSLNFAERARTATLGKNGEETKQSMVWNFAEKARNPVLTEHTPRPVMPEVPPKPAPTPTPTMDQLRNVATTTQPQERGAPAPTRLLPGAPLQADAQRAIGAITAGIPQGATIPPTLNSAPVDTVTGATPTLRAHMPQVSPSAPWQERLPSGALGDIIQTPASVADAFVRGIGKTTGIAQAGAAIGERNPELSQMVRSPLAKAALEGKLTKAPEGAGEQFGEIAGMITPYIIAGPIQGIVSAPVKAALTKYAPKLAGTALGRLLPTILGRAALGGAVAAGRVAVKGAAAPDEFQISEALKEIGADTARFAAFAAAGDLAGKPAGAAISRVLSRSVQSGRLAPQLAEIITAMGRGGATGTTLASMETALRYLRNPSEFDKAEAAGDILTTALFFAGMDTIFTLGAMAGQGFRMQGQAKFGPGVRGDTSTESKVFVTGARNPAQEGYREFKPGMGVWINGKGDLLREMTPEGVFKYDIWKQARPSRAAAPRAARPEAPVPAQQQAETGVRGLLPGTVAPPAPVAPATTPTETPAQKALRHNLTISEITQISGLSPEAQTAYYAMRDTGRPHEEALTAAMPAPTPEPAPQIDAETLMRDILTRGGIKPPTQKAKRDLIPDMLQSKDGMELSAMAGQLGITEQQLLDNLAEPAAAGPVARQEFAEEDVPFSDAPTHPPAVTPPAAPVPAAVTPPATATPPVPVDTTPAATPEAPAKQEVATAVTPMSDTDKQPWEMSKGEFEAKALYQGVRAGNIDDRHGLSGYVTPLPGTARAFGEREGAGFLMNITYNENMPEGTFTDPDTGDGLTPEEFWKYRGQVGTGLPEEIGWVTQLKFSDMAQAKEFAKDPHKYLVQKALSQGLPVPPEVLAEYGLKAAEAPPVEADTVTLKRPIEEVKQQNYRMPLSQYTDKLYHETNIENALRMTDPGIMADMTNQRIYFSNNPDLALGQGQNKGVLVELSAEGLQGQVNTGKPTWEAAYSQGGAEFIANLNKQTDYRNAVQSIIVKPDAKGSKSDTTRLKNLVAGWESVKNDDGSVTYRKPSAKAPPKATPAPVEAVSEAGKGIAPAGTIQPLSTGKTATAKTERGTSIETQYAIVEAKELVPSHDTRLKVNPGYPAELQPRDRSRVASEGQISRIVGRLEPEFLGESPKASEGAPIVGPDGVVESGNARIIALNRIYDRRHGNAAKYKGWLAENAEKFGIDKAELAKAKNPVLVRVRQSDVDRVKFTQEANEQAVAAMSASEQAVADAKQLTGGIMDKFYPGDTGEIMTAANRGFVNNFMQNIASEAERGKYLTKDGSISQEGLNRIRNAVFARAYGDTGAIEKLAESTDVNVKNQINAMLMAAPRMVRLRELIDKGEYYPLDIAPELSAAMNKLSSLREQGQAVEVYLRQQGLFGEDLSPLAKDILSVFNKHKRSGKKIASILQAYADAVEMAGSPKQQKMFATEGDPERADIWTRAVRKVEGLDEGTLQTTLFPTQGMGGTRTGTPGEKAPSAIKPDEKLPESLKRTGARDRDLDLQLFAEGKELERLMYADDKNMGFAVAKEMPAPQKTVKAYKLFRTLKSRPGELFPLFIGKTEPTPLGKWVPAEFIPTKGYADRPGWHAGILPHAPHLTKKDGTVESGRVWAEVEMPADKEWQSVADANTETRDIRDRVPESGHYRWRRGDHQGGEWLIGGAIKVNRVLTNKEVRQKVMDAGLSGELGFANAEHAQMAFNAKDLGFSQWAHTWEEDRAAIFQYTGENTPKAAYEKLTAPLKGLPAKEVKGRRMDLQMFARKTGTEPDPEREKARRRFFAVANQMNLDRGQRIEMARYITGRPELNSTSELSRNEMQDLADFLSRHHLQLKAANQAKLDEAKRVSVAKAKEAKKELDKALKDEVALEDRIVRHKELGYEVEMASDVYRLLGRSIPEGFEDHPVGWMWDKQVYVPSAREMAKWPVKELRGLTKDNNIAEQYIKPIFRVLPREFTDDGMKAKQVMTAFQDKFLRRLNDAIRGFTAQERINVAAMLEGVLEKTGKEGIAADKIKANFFDPLFDQLVTAGKLEKAQYVSEYFSRIGNEVKKISGDPLSVPKRWFTHSRTGKMEDYKKDVAEVANIYINAASKAIHVDPFLEKWKPEIKQWPKSKRSMAEVFADSVYGRPTSWETMMNQLIKDGYQVLGKDLPEGRRPTQDVSRAIISAVVQAYMGFNPGSVIKNLTQKMLAVADVATRDNPLRGFTYLVRAQRFKMTKEGQEFVDKYCTLLKDRTYMEGLEKTSRYEWKINQILDATSKVTMWGFRWADISNVTDGFLIGLFAALEDGKPMVDALWQANDVALRTQFPYDIRKAMAFHNPVIRLAGLFSSWPINMFELGMDWVKPAKPLPEGKKPIDMEPDAESNAWSMKTQSEWSKLLLLAGLMGGLKYLMNKMGLHLRISMLDSASDHVVFKAASGEQGAVTRYIGDFGRAAQRMATFDTDEWVKAMEELAYLAPGGVAYKRAMRFNRAAQDNWRLRDARGRVYYEYAKEGLFYDLTGIPGEALRALLGQTSESNEHWRDRYPTITDRVEKKRDEMLRRVIGN